MMTLEFFFFSGAGVPRMGKAGKPTEFANYCEMEEAISMLSVLFPPPPPRTVNPPQASTAQIWVPKQASTVAPGEIGGPGKRGGLRIFRGREYLHSELPNGPRTSSG